MLTRHPNHSRRGLAALSHAQSGGSALRRTAEMPLSQWLAAGPIAPAQTKIKTARRLRIAYFINDSHDTDQHQYLLNLWILSADYEIRTGETVDTTDKREAQALAKKPLGEIQQGKAASNSGREFARKPFGDAAKVYQGERQGHVAERTIQFEGERRRPLAAYFQDRPLFRVKAAEIAGYQKQRLAEGVSGRTINMEVGVQRRMLKRAKVWSSISEDVRTFPEHARNIGRVLDAEQKTRLFQVAGCNPSWMVAHCAAVLAVSTTCRGVEIKHLRWRDVDLFSSVLDIRSCLEIT